MFRKATDRKPSVTAREKLTRATKASLQPAALRPAARKDHHRPEENATLQADIPFAFLFLNHH
jgi:hypothetical protein